MASSSSPGADRYDIPSTQGVIVRLRDILSDINLRLVQAESRFGVIDRSAQEVANQGVRYLESVIVPAATKVADLLRSVGDLFTTTSTTSLTPGLGTKVLVVEDMTFAPLGNVAITKVGDSHTGMIGGVVSFDGPSRTLTVDVVYFWGSLAPNASWDVVATLPYDAHAGRQDNPHGTTAHQVGSYTTDEVDQAIENVRTLLLGTATAAGDTLGELEQRLVALIGTADSAGDSLGELEAMIADRFRRANKKAVVYATALG